MKHYQYPKTIKDINKHLTHLGPVKVVKGEGYFYIYSDDPEMGLRIAGLYTSSIHVAKLSQLSLRQWIHEIESLFDPEQNKGYSDNN